MNDNMTVTRKRNPKIPPSRNDRRVKDIKPAKVNQKDLIIRQTAQSPGSFPRSKNMTGI